MEMTGDDQRQQSLNSVQSPLKIPHSTEPKVGGSEHTLCVDEGDEARKGDYELARDRRVAALQELLRPVETAATAL